jgi:putative hydrolase of the HAD superfamily
MASEPKVLSFDVVGTLIDFETGLLSYLRRTCPQAADLSDDAILDPYREARTSKDAWLFPDDLVRCYREIAPKLGFPRDEAVAEGMRDSSREWPAFPDSVDALRRLRARYKLVAMTNARRWALDAMADTLGNPFHDEVSVDEARCEKPDPAYFAFVRGRLSRDGHGMHDILHVAQSQYHDIGVAKRLNYTVAWIERRKGRGFGGTIAAAEITTPDYHFSTLAELADAAEAGTLRMRESA